jgi:probable F420-dependent oxidoreductase
VGQVTVTQYGIQLPVQSQSTLFAEPWEAGAGPEDLLAVARTADRAGFAYVACCDHVAIPRRLAPAMGTVWYDPVATLAFLAAATERVRLLSHVAVVGLRHPLLTAKQYATLDHLSGGRLILGVGAGHVEEEFEALGVDFEGRGPVLDETIDALHAALGPDEFPEHHGKRHDFQDLGQLPRPAQDRVPLWVGGSSPARPDRAAAAAAARGGDRDAVRHRRHHRAPLRRHAHLGRRPPHRQRPAAGPRRVAAGVPGDGGGPDPGAVPQPWPERTDRTDRGVRGGGGRTVVATAVFGRRPAVRGCVVGQHDPALLESLNTPTPTAVWVGVRT